MRAVFSDTFSTWMELSGFNTAAQTRNAAEGRGRPARRASEACSARGPVTLAVRSAAVVGTLNSGSMSSVWLREGEGSLTVVVPRAYTPASSTAVLSWADAMGRQVDGAQGRGCRTR